MVMQDFAIRCSGANRRLLFLLSIGIFLVSSLTQATPEAAPTVTVKAKKERKRSNPKAVLKRVGESLFADAAPATGKKKGKNPFKQVLKEMSKPTLRRMSEPQLAEGKKRALDSNNKEGAIRYLTAQIKISDNLEEIRNLELERADLFFDLWQIREAQAAFIAWIEMYPGSPEVEYALYKAILCSFYRTLPADRDQTNTEKTLDLITQYFSKTNGVKYNIEVKDIEISCNTKLLQKELIRIDLCCKHSTPKAILAAEKRLKKARETLLAKVPTMEGDLLVAEYKLAMTKKEPAMEILWQDLRARHTTHPFVLAHEADRYAPHLSRKQYAKGIQHHNPLMLAQGRRAVSGDVLQPTSFAQQEVLVADAVPAKKAHFSKRF